MHSSFLLLPFLIASTAALSNTIQARQDDTPDPNCPENWQFDLSSYSGPGCPDFSPTYKRPGYSRTYPDWGSHFVPGCAQQWAWFSFPYLTGNIDNSTGVVYFADEKRNSTWCEMKIKYQEMKGTFAPYPVKKGEEQFHLVLHGNGTTVEGKYGLDEGVSANWKLTFLPMAGVDKPKVVDEIVVKGPLWNETKPALQLDWSTVDDTTPRWTQAACGPTTFNMRIDLEFKSETPYANGAIESRQDLYNGIRLGPTVGISHSWERCTKA